MIHTGLRDLLNQRCNQALTLAADRRGLTRTSVTPQRGEWDLFGAPLFDGLAHRFTVRVDAGLSDRAKADLDALVEREKPAHTLHVICETVPGVLSGESRVGIDSVLGNDSAPSRLGDGSPLETGTVLGGDPASRLGDNL